MDSASRAGREQEFRERFGDLLTMRDLAVVLRYPSLAAIRKAHARGKLPLKLVQLPRRRGWFVTPKAVAEFLEQLDQNLSDSNESVP